MTDAPKSSETETIQARSSVRNRVIAGFAAIVIAFSCLMFYSLSLYRRTVLEISLINDTYLPLTLGTSKIRATQLVFNTLMDRLTSDPYHQSVTRDWLKAARRYRPATLNRLTINLRWALKKDIPPGEIIFLSEISHRLKDVESRYRANESKFARLFTDIDSGHGTEATYATEALKRSERLLDDVLAGIESDVEKHIMMVSDEAEQNAVRGIWALAIMTIAALLAGVAIVASINRLLAPLKRLQMAVANVAGGQLNTRIQVSSDDEIGVLASNFNKMTNALVERDKMLIRSARLATAGKIAAQVTHEIRNPLSSLGLNAELLEEELDDDGDKSEAKDLLKAMQDEIERLTEVTESYLRFARMPSPRLQSSNINESVQTALDFMKHEFKEAKVAVSLKLQKDIVPQLFDPDQIRQVIINLLRNAREAMLEGGSITVSTTQNDAFATMAFTDTGPGVAVENIDQIFDAFFTTKSTGTGLGLALVRQICLAHSGDIKYKNNPDQGGTFIVNLPKQ